MTCRICNNPIKPGERTYRSRYHRGRVHALCIPALVRDLGEPAVKVYLRHGPAAFFPERHRPQPVDHPEPEKEPFLLRFLAALWR